MTDMASFITYANQNITFSPEFLFNARYNNLMAAKRTVGGRNGPGHI